MTEQLAITARFDAAKGANSVAAPMTHVSRQIRVYEIDGIRGWAALSVMLAHLCFGMFNEFGPQFMPIAVRFVLEPFLNGTLDVAVFFVLSGDALSAFYWVRRSGYDIARMVIKRYFRLEIPIFASCLIAFALVRIDLRYNIKAAVILGDESWLGSFLLTDWSVRDLFGYSVYGVFFEHKPERALNPFLGSMRVELLGSMLVFVYLGLDRYVRWRSIILALLCFICLFCGSFLACFAFGMLCGYFRFRGGFARLQRNKATTALAVMVAVSAMLAAAVCNHVYPRWDVAPIIASCAVVFSVYSSAHLMSVFRTAFSLWLGHISFALFLVHFAVMVTIASGAVVLADRLDATGPLVIWSIILGSAACSLLAAVLFLPVEHLAAWLSQSVWRIVIRPERGKNWTMLPLPFSSDRRHATNDLV
jgi:peptidoglycan/LPS O-acetylase OafA/YrhL